MMMKKCLLICFVLGCFLHAAAQNGTSQENIEYWTKQIQVYPNNPELWHQRALVYKQLKDYGHAVSDIDKALQLNPQNASIWNDKGGLYFDQEKYDLAIINFTKAYQLNPGDKVVYNNISVAYYYKGHINYDQGKYDSAIDDNTHAVNINPSHPNYLINLVLSYCANNEFGLAASYFDQYKSLGNPGYLSNQSYTFLINYISACINHLNFNNYADALTVLLKSLKEYQLVDIKNKDSNTDIEYANVLAKTGWVYEQSGNKENALEYYVKAQTISPPVQDVATKISRLQQKQQEEIITDNTAPVIQMITPQVTRSQTVEADDNGSGQMFVSGTAKDIAGISWIKVNGTIVTPVATGGYFSINMPSSTLKLIIQASDTKGNIATESYKVEQPETTSQTQENSYRLPPITIDDNPVFHAVLIACSDYHSGGWRPLPSTISEAKQMKEVLMSKYGFSGDNIMELYNKDYSGILSSLSSKLESMKDNDNLVIYFAGHGTYKKKGSELVGYWVPVNATNIDVDYISSKKLDELIAGSNVKHILMLSDACYSGAMRSNDEVKTPSKWEYKLRSRQILTSGGLEKVPGESVFIKMVMQALQKNEDPYLPVSELYSIIYGGVKKQTENEPKLNDFGKDGNEGGQFYFMKKN